MPERSEAEIDEYLVEVDRRLRRIQLELAPGRDPAAVREPAPVKEAAPAQETAPVKEAAPAQETAPAQDTAPASRPAPRPNPDQVVTTKLIASMRELLDALEGSLGS